MTDPEIRPETEALARKLDSAEEELRTIRSALATVSLEMADEKAAAGAVPRPQPLRTRPAGNPPPLPADVGAQAAATPRPTLEQRLKTALPR